MDSGGRFTCSSTQGQHRQRDRSPSLRLHPWPGEEHHGHDAEQEDAPAGDVHPEEAPRAPHDKPGAQRRADAEHGAGHQQQPRLDGRDAVDGLVQQGQEEEDGHLAQHAEEVAQVGGEEGALEDDVARGEGVRGDADLDGHEGGEEGRRHGERRDGLRLGPALVAAVVEAEEEAQHGRDEEEGAQEVDPGELLPPVGVVPLGEVEHKVDSDEG